MPINQVDLRHQKEITHLRLGRRVYLITQYIENICELGKHRNEEWVYYKGTKGAGAESEKDLMMEKLRGHVESGEAADVAQ